ncbi:MAG TPA: diphosphomevalonate decarboxylase [Anaerolineales bacterium]|nr:diphosphomevalonate decarboxylase [Anaerolineales bacterium]
MQKTDVCATATAHPNIAFIKYWGNRDNALRLPANGSISMNLGGLETRTTVTFEGGLTADGFRLNGAEVKDKRFRRVTDFLDHVRLLAGTSLHARVESTSNFPVGAGIASSASGFASLALAATRAAGLDLAEVDLSRLARLGSGSACRSIPSGFVEWMPGSSDQDSYAQSIAPPGYWELADCIAMVSTGHKKTGSTEGHLLAESSPLQSARIADAPRRLDLCRQALLDRDLDGLAEIAELDSNLMHAVMMTSNPPIYYWEPSTIHVMRSVQSWRWGGLPAFFTIDAGPNVHVLCAADSRDEVAGKLSSLESVQRVLVATPGGPARLLDAD